MGPRLKGYKRDSNPNVKELPPIAPIYDKPTPPPSAAMKNANDHYEEKQDTLPPTLFYSDRHIPSNFDPKTGPEHLEKHKKQVDSKPTMMNTQHDFDEPQALPLEQEFEDRYIPSDSYRKSLTPSMDEDEQKRDSKEYAPASYTQYPPPRYGLIIKCQ